ncbi:unnamed protein product [Effrenium voratum]|nr:unnamed protein product [Effrenium voratum]
MPSAMAKCCAALLRLLRRRRGRGRAPEADAPLVGPSPAPADASAPEEEVLAPPVRALTKVQEEFEAAMKAANQEMHQRVKYYKDLNGGGNLTKHQEIDVRNLWNVLSKTAQLRRQRAEEGEAMCKADEGSFTEDEAAAAS